MKTNDNKRKVKKGLLKFSLKNLAAIIGLTSIVSVGGWSLTKINDLDNSNDVAIEYDGGHIHDIEDELDFDFETEEEIDEKDNEELDSTELGPIWVDPILPTVEEEKTLEDKNLFITDSIINDNENNIVDFPELPINPGTEDNKPGQEDNTPGHEDNTPGEEDKHEHSFGRWTCLNDTQEVRSCSCGEKEYRGHIYGAWKDNGNGTESRICHTCGNVMTQDKNVEHEHSWSNWVGINDTQEERTCSCGEKEYQGHEYGAWKDNGNGTESRTCGTCGYEMTQDKEHEHSWSEWNAQDDVNEYRECSCGEVETREHKYKDWTHNETTDNCEKGCSTCSHVVTQAHTYEVVSTTHEKIENNDQVHYEVVESECTTCHAEKTDKNEVSHEWDIVVAYENITDSSHTHKRITTYTCKDCNYTYEIAETLDHVQGELVSVNKLDDVDQHTFTYNCSDCGNNYTTAPENCYGGTTTTKEENGAYYEYKTCEGCEQEYAKSGHDHAYGQWEHQDDVSVRTCSCGQVEKCETHAYGEGVFDGTNIVQTCGVCGKENTIAHQHTESKTDKSGYNDTYCYEEWKVCECGHEIEGTRTGKKHEVTEVEVETGKFYAYCNSWCGYEYEYTKSTTGELSNDSVDEVIDDLTQEELESIKQALNDIAVENANEFVAEESTEEVTETPAAETVEETIVDETVVIEDVQTEETAIEEIQIEEEVEIEENKEEVESLEDTNVLTLTLSL